MGTLPKNGSATVEATATPEQVWTLLTDITRAGEWSHETQGGEWLDGATAAAPGRPLPRPQPQRPHQVVAGLRGAGRRRAPR